MAVDIFAFDKNGDLKFNNGDLVSVSGLDEIKQTLMLILQTPKGRWIDEDVGMDFDWVLDGYDEAGAKLAVEEALKQDKRVTEVTDVQADYIENTRHVVFSIVCQTTLGELDFNKEVDLNAIDG